MRLLGCLAGFRPVRRGLAPQNSLRLDDHGWDALVHDGLGDVRSPHPGALPVGGRLVEGVHEHVAERMERRLLIRRIALWSVVGGTASGYVIMARQE